VTTGSEELRVKMRRRWTGAGARRSNGSRRRGTTTGTHFR